MIPAALRRIWWRRYLRRNTRPWDDLESFPALDPAGQRRELGSRLLSQIRYLGRRADALPEWREAARIEDPAEAFRCWPSLPVLTKQTLAARFRPEDVQALCGLPGVVSSSGGSTGEPTHFFHDTNMVLSCVASSVYAQLRMGWRLGMPLVKLWGSERDIGRDTTPRNRLLNHLLGTILVEGYRMDAATVERVVQLIRRNSPVALAGFTTMLEYVARGVLDRGDTFEPGSVHVGWNGGEMLFDEQVELFRRAFGAPLLNLYGGRELSVTAFQEAAGRPLRLTRPWLFLELVDEEGKPASPGEIGRILLTSTVCRGTPFIRYDIGDLAAADPAHDTEAGLTHLRTLQGRTSGLLRLSNGRVVQTLYWNHFFKEVPEVRQFQVVVKRDGALEILLLGGGFTADRETALRSTLQQFLGDVPVQFDWVARIPRTRQGKLLQVVHEAGP